MPGIETPVREPTSGPDVRWQRQTLSSGTANSGNPPSLQFVVLTAGEPRYTETEQQVGDLARLPRGWDGHDGLPAQPSAVNGALKFLADLAIAYPGLVPPPLAGPLPDGGVAFVWRYENREIEILFLGDGTAEFAVSDRARPTEFREGLKQDELLALLLQHLFV